MQIKQMWYPIRGNECHDVLEKEGSSFNVGSLTVGPFIEKNVSTVSKDCRKSWFHPEPGIIYILICFEVVSSPIKFHIDLHHGGRTKKHHGTETEPPEAWQMSQGW